MGFSVQFILCSCISVVCVLSASKLNVKHSSLPGSLHWHRVIKQVQYRYSTDNHTTGSLGAGTIEYSVIIV